MAATPEGALKAVVESLLQPLVPGLIAYRKMAKPAVARPYVTIFSLNLSPDELEDGGPGTCVDTCQVDLWEDWKNLETGAITENYLLLPALQRGLHGARPPLVAGRTGYRIFLVSSIPVPEPEEENLVHNALTVEIWREF